MPGIRNATGAAIDATVSTLLTQLSSYFALQQSQFDINTREIFIAWFFGKLVNLDSATAAAARYVNLEQPGLWDKPLSGVGGVDPLAGA